MKESEAETQELKGSIAQLQLEKAELIAKVTFHSTNKQR